MDIIGIISLLIGFAGVIGGFLLEGGEVGMLLLLPPFLIVFVGSIGIILFQYKIQDFMGALSALGKSFSAKEKELPQIVIEKICNIANICRAEGLLKMQNLMEDSDLQKAEFLTLKAGMVMALDMKSADEIEDALSADEYAFSTQRGLHAKIWGDWGGYTPSLGIVGTVMGLVHVLSNMESPEQLVGAIAGAFIATLYGVGFANLFFLPAAGRIKNMMKREQLLREMMVAGICMIVRGESSRSIENKLSVYYQAFPDGFRRYKEGISK